MKARPQPEPLPVGITATETASGPRYQFERTIAGRRRRQFFRDLPSALKAKADADKNLAQHGKAFDVMPAAERAKVMLTLSEIHRCGQTLGGVWEAFKGDGAPKTACSLGEAVKELLEAKKESGCRPKYLKTLKWYLGKFAEGRSALPVNRIGIDALNQWFEARDEAPRSKRGHVALLSALFAHCIRRGYITDNPCKRLDPVRLDRQSPAALTVRQCQRAMVWSRRRCPELLAWLALAMFCGLRPDSECDHVGWKDIDLDRKRIVIPRSKIRGTVPRIIELDFCPPALAWLRLAKDEKCPLPLTRAFRVRRIRRLRAYLGFKRWAQDILRHTAASNLFAHYQDAGKVAAFLGHSAGTLMRDYKSLVYREDAARWMAMIPHVKA